MFLHGPIIRSALVPFSVVAVLSVRAQTYTHPTVGVQSTYSGACLVSTCSGTYYDSGGAGGNYAASTNAIYRTFCPNSAGMCMRATFTSYSMNDTYFLCFGPNSCCDYLQILNGPAQNSPALYSDCVTSPGTVTATNPSGCLTFRFVSDNTVQLAGWSATLSCVPCAGGPAGNTNADCNFATPVCTDQPLTDASVGPGIAAEGCSGCNTSEVYTNWYRIQVQTSGTLSFTINPNNNADDFDPVVYGPNVTCGSLGTPIRCSYAANAGNGNTGLGSGAVDNSEDVFGDQWVAPLNVTAGQTYYVLINGWSATSGSNGFLLDWTGTASLNCAILPVEMTSLVANCENGWPELEWSTASEHNSSHFMVQRSPNGADWSDIGLVIAAGNSSSANAYRFHDPRPLNTPRVYYRLLQVDLDGAEHLSQVAALKGCGQDGALVAIPNPAEQSVLVTVAVPDRANGEASLSLWNAMGVLVLQQRVQLEAGRATVQLDISAMPSGAYTLSLGRDADHVQYRTIVLKP